MSGLKRRVRSGKAVWLSLCLALALGSPVLGASSLDEKIAQQKKQLDLLNKRIQYHTRELAEAKAKEKGYLRELSVFDQRVQQSEEQIALLDLQIEKNERELKEVGESIEEHNKRIKALQDILSKRCVAIYKYSGAADLNVMLSAADLAELNNLTYLMNRLSRQDEKDIEALETEKLALKSDELKLQQTRGQLAQRHKQRTREQQANKQAGAHRRELLARVEKNKKAHEAAMRESEEAEKALQKKIAEYLKKKALAAQAGKNKGGGISSYEGNRKFDWPVPDRKVTSRFGMRVHPRFKTKREHTGIDIASPLGTPIKTAGPGEVIFAGWMRGYGQVVIIDHGGGYATVYAHMSRIQVDEGDVVKKGATIGKVGMTGVATGAHLHFEVRVNGAARNPLKYL